MIIKLLMALWVISLIELITLSVALFLYYEMIIEVEEDFFKGIGWSGLSGLALGGLGCLFSMGRVDNER